MKKLFIFLVFLTSTVLQVTAGGLVTNSNQSASYYRMLARGASTSGDAVYYNPAGLAFLDQGLTVSLNTQMIWMERVLNNNLGTLNNPEFVGTLYVPVFPGVYAAYKTGNWAFSLGFNPPAGGGSIDFAKGMPMLENTISLFPGMLSANAIYSMESMLKGSSIVYGVQAGATYKINDKIGVFGGVRMLFASNSYEGYLRNITIDPKIPGLVDGNMLNSAGLISAGVAIDAQADAIPPEALADPEVLETYTKLKTLAGGLKLIGSNVTDKMLDVKQKGNGFAPILGVHVNLGNLNLAAKYEFNAKITLKNETIKDDVNMYPDGKEPRSDVPALLSLAGSYDIIPSLKLSVTYIHHFEPQATIQDGTGLINRQDLIDKGTNEFFGCLFPLERT